MYTWSFGTKFNKLSDKEKNFTFMKEMTNISDMERSERYLRSTNEDW